MIVKSTFNQDPRSDNSLLVNFAQSYGLTGSIASTTKCNLQIKIEIWLRETVGLQIIPCQRNGRTLSQSNITCLIVKSLVHAHKTHLEDLLMF